MHLHDRVNTQENRGSSGPTKPVGFKWAFETGGKVLSSPAVVDGTVLFGSTDGNVHALDMITGDQQWVYETGGAVVSSPAVSEGSVYIGSNDSNVYALDVNSGERQWQYQTGGRVRSSPTVVEGKLTPAEEILAIGSDDGTVYVLDTATGEELDDPGFGFSTDGPVVSTPLLDLHFTDRKKFWQMVGSTDGSTYQGDLQPQGFSYSSSLGAPIYSSVSTVFDPDFGNDWFFGADDGILRKTREGGRGTTWEFRTNGKIRASPAVTSQPHVVYAGSWDGNVYAVDGDTGELLWRFQTDGKVESSPAVADGVLYVGSEDNHVYAIDTESGEELWDFRTGGSVYSSPAVVNGTVFVGSNDGRVYALTACQ